MADKTLEVLATEIDSPDFATRFNACSALSLELFKKYSDEMNYGSSKSKMVEKLNEKTKSEMAENWRGAYQKISGLEPVQKIHFLDMAWLYIEQKKQERKEVLQELCKYFPQLEIIEPVDLRLDSYNNIGLYGPEKEALQSVDSLAGFGIDGKEKFSSINYPSRRTIPKALEEIAHITSHDSVKLAAIKHIDCMSKGDEEARESRKKFLISFLETKYVERYSDVVKDAVFECLKKDISFHDVLHLDLDRKYDKKFLNNIISLEETIEKKCSFIRRYDDASIVRDYAAENLTELIKNEDTKPDILFIAARSYGNGACGAIRHLIGLEPTLKSVTLLGNLLTDHNYVTDLRENIGYALTKNVEFVKKIADEKLRDNLLEMIADDRSFLFSFDNSELKKERSVAKAYVNSKNEIKRKEEENFGKNIVELIQK